MRIERIRPQHVLKDFDCGVKELNEWLIKHAIENERRDLSRTFVLLGDSDEVVGFYSLTVGGVNVEKLPKKLAKGLPADSDRFRPGIPIVSGRPFRWFPATLGELNTALA